MASSPPSKRRRKNLTFDDAFETLLSTATSSSVNRLSPVVVFAHGAGAPSSSEWMIRSFFFFYLSLLFNLLHQLPQLWPKADTNNLGFNLIFAATVYSHDECCSVWFFIQYLFVFFFYEPPQSFEGWNSFSVEEIGKSCLEFLVEFDLVF